MDKALQNSIIATSQILDLTPEFDLPYPILFSMIFYLNNSEIALRHEAVIYFKTLLSQLVKFPEFKEIQYFVSSELLLEIWNNLQHCDEDLMLKSQFEVLKEAIWVMHDLQIPEFKDFSDLNCLIEEEFFENIFSIKLPIRFKAIWSLCEKIDDGSITSHFSLVKFALPIANYFIFKKPQKENQKWGVMLSTK